MFIVDRSFRIALEPARAQVAAAQANIAQLDVSFPGPWHTAICMAADHLG
jgi:hypothetical protein